MKTLDFQDALITNTFSRSNSYAYTPYSYSGIYFNKNQSEVPFITRAHVANVSMGDFWHDEEILYAKSLNQFNGRLVSTAKLKEILDTSRVPLKLKIGDYYYLVGKGFLAYIDSNDNIELLFLACVPTSKKIVDISQVKFYISRNVYSEVHKKVSPAIRDIVMEHTGDVVITSNIDNHIGLRLVLPDFKTLKEKREYTAEVVNFLIEKLRKERR